MRNLLRNVRASERRDAFSAFATLFGLIGSHTILETARDALFLAEIPAERLPLVYIGIAALSLGVARLQRGLHGREGRVEVSRWIAVAAAITLSFRGLVELGSGALFGLYLWSGLLTTFVLVHFWTLLGELFTVTQAKRIYGFIGAGSISGALFGSLAATALARVGPPEDLILAAGLGLALTAVGPRLLRSSGSSEALNEQPSEALEGLVRLFGPAYPRWVLALVVTAAFTLTWADFLFKQAAAEAAEQGVLPTLVGPPSLGAFFAEVYLILNVLSLISQLGLLTWLLRRFDLATTLGVLPALVTFAGGGFIFVGGIGAALVLKGVEGTLRHSVHKTSVELLFVPLPEHVRGRIKGVVDVAGQRGGQALASISILAVAPLLTDAALGTLLTLAAFAWFLLTLVIRRDYLRLFRDRLHGGLSVKDFPELDLGSLETLVTTLDEDDDAEVIAALDVLEREARSHLVPTLILHHPSPEVVAAALGVLARSRRTRALTAVERCLEHPDPLVRTAAVSALAPLGGLRGRIDELEEDPDADVRAAALANRVVWTKMPANEAASSVQDILQGSLAGRVALAEAIARSGAREHAALLVQLVQAPEAKARRVAAEAMAQLAPESTLLPTLIELLGDEATRPDAQRGLLAHGAAAILALEGALANAALKPRVRLRIPHVLAAFPDRQAAADVLVARLVKEPNGSARFRIIRALEDLVAKSPHLDLDTAALGAVLRQTLGRAYQQLELRLALQGTPQHASEGQELLIRALRDKQSHAVGRAFRLLSLLYPVENFAGILRGLDSPSPSTRAGSLELVENLLPQPLRDAVLGLVDDRPDEARLEAAGPYHTPKPVTYTEVLKSLLTRHGETLQILAIHHIGEAGLIELEADVAAAELKEGEQDRALSLARLRARRKTLGGFEDAR